MSIETKVFPDPDAVATAFAADFAAWINQQSGEKITVALSGGSTPKMLFEKLASDYSNKVDWSRVHFFWGDERCVPPDDAESNFGVAKSLFLEPVGVPEKNIHRVRGEENPIQECLRYEHEIRSYVNASNRLPQFDLVILGMGDDGHTASIFPHEAEFLTSTRICEVATHPTTGQKRITLTGPMINESRMVVFLITGGAKAKILSQVIHKTGSYEHYPAAHISASQLTFYVDNAAAAKL